MNLGWGTHTATTLIRDSAVQFITTQATVIEQPYRRTLRLYTIQYILLRQLLHSNAADSSLFRRLTITHSQLILISLLFCWFLLCLQNPLGESPPRCSNKALFKRKRGDLTFLRYKRYTEELGFSISGKTSQAFNEPAAADVMTAGFVGNMTTTRVSDTWSFRLELSLWNFTWRLICQTLALLGSTI